MKPLCIDIFCGLGGWTEGFLAEGWDVVGFDIERHVYGAHRYPAQLVLQDARTIHGAQFLAEIRRRPGFMFVASSPCQEFSYRAMPWKRAKALPPPHFGMELFAQAARIQAEAIAAAGHHIPMIQENVCGAQKWVGRARWHYGSYYLWGDVPALMPIPYKARKVPGFRFDGSGKSFQSASVEGTKVGGLSWSDFGKEGYKAVGFNVTAAQRLKAEDTATKTTGLLQQRDGHGHTRHLTNQREHDAVKHGGSWFDDPSSPSRVGGHKSDSRKAAAARIAKIPFPLASHIARTYFPVLEEVA